MKNGLVSIRATFLPLALIVLALRLLYSPCLAQAPQSEPLPEETAATFHLDGKALTYQIDQALYDLHFAPNQGAPRPTDYLESKVYEWKARAEVFLEAHPNDGALLVPVYFLEVLPRLIELRASFQIYPQQGTLVRDAFRFPAALQNRLRMRFIQSEDGDTYSPWLVSSDSTSPTHLLLRASDTHYQRYVNLALLRRPSLDGYFKLASYLLTKEKWAADEQLRVLLPEETFSDLNTPPELIERIRGFPLQDSVRQDVRLVEQETEFRASLLRAAEDVKLEKNPSLMEPIALAIADTLLSQTHSNAPPLEERKKWQIQLAQLIQEMESAQFLEQLKKALANTPHLLSQTNSEALPSLLANLVTQARVDTVISYLERLQDYRECLPLIELSTHGDLPLDHVEYERVRKIQEAIQSDPYLKALIVAENHGQLERYPTKLGPLLEKRAAKYLELFPALNLSEWIAASNTSKAKEKNEANQRRWKWLFSLSKRFEEEEKSDVPELRILVEIAWSKLQGGGAPVEAESIDLLEALTTAKDYESARGLYLNRIAILLGQESVEGGYLRMERLSSLHRAKLLEDNRNAYVDRPTPLDQYLDQEVQKKIRSLDWQIIQLGVSMGFHLKPLANGPSLKQILIQAEDRRDYRNAFREALKIAVFDTYRILFEKINYKGQTLELRQVLAPFVSSPDDSPTPEAIANSLSAIQQAAHQIHEKIQAILSEIASAKNPKELAAPLMASAFGRMMSGLYPAYGRIYRDWTLRTSAQSSLQKLQNQLHGPTFLFFLGDIGLRAIGFLKKSATGQAIEWLQRFLGSGFYTQSLLRPMLWSFRITMVLRGYDLLGPQYELNEQKRRFSEARAMGSGDFSARDYFQMKDAYASSRFHFLVLDLPLFLATDLVPSASSGLRYLKTRSSFRNLGLEPGNFASLEEAITNIRASTSTSPAYRELAENAYRYLQRIESLATLRRVR